MENNFSLKRSRHGMIHCYPKNGIKTLCNSTMGAGWSDVKEIKAKDVVMICVRCTSVGFMTNIGFPISPDSTRNIRNRKMSFE